MVLNDFRQHFDVLLRQISKDLPYNSTKVALMDDMEATENIIKHVELSRSQFKIGVSQVSLHLSFSDFYTLENTLLPLALHLIHFSSLKYSIPFLGVFPLWCCKPVGRQKEPKSFNSIGVVPSCL